MAKRRLRFVWITGLLAVFVVVAAAAAVVGCGGLMKASVRAPTVVDVAMAPGGAELVPGVGERLLVQTLALAIVTKKPAEAADEARKIVAELEGFVVESVEEDDDRARLTARIPAGRLDEAHTRLAALGEVADEVAGGTDVTEAVRDLKIRLDNARKTRDAYVALLDRATTVEETLKVEKELERVTVEIETFQAQLEELETGVRLATVAIRFARPVRPGPLGWIFYGGYLAVKWLFVWD